MLHIAGYTRSKSTYPDSQGQTSRVLEFILIGSGYCMGRAWVIITLSPGSLWPGNEARVSPTCWQLVLTMAALSAHMIGHCRSCHHYVKISPCVCVCVYVCVCVCIRVCVTEVGYSGDGTWVVTCGLCTLTFQVSDYGQCIGGKIREQFMLSSLPHFPAFADLLSLHLITFSMFFL